LGGVPYMLVYLAVCLITFIAILFVNMKNGENYQ
jgi:hypothetical protein